METTELGWGRALVEARRMLGRFTDTDTRSRRDDLAQETTVVLWQWARQMRDPKRVGGAVRTIVLRQRMRMLDEVRRGRWLEFGVAGVDAEVGAETEPAVRERDEPRLCIDGVTVPLRWAREQLPAVLERLAPIDRQLLLSFYAGFCCAELALRVGRSVDCVKTRLFRARRRIKKEFEAIVRAAGDLGQTLFDEE